MPSLSSPLVAAVLAVALAAPAAHPPVHLIQDRSERTSSLGLTRLLTVVPLPGRARFVAAEHFRKSIASEARVRIAWIGRNFRRHFLSKIEENVRPAEIGIHRLRRSARDAAIIDAIGERHETDLAHLWAMLLRQPAGETGALAVRGSANVFYIRAANGTLWAVDAVWGGAGWEIGASATDDPRPWRAGRVIISR